MDDGRLLVLGAAGLVALASVAGAGSAARRRRTPEARRDEAVAAYGTTDDPFSAGFLLADGRWLDLSEGGGMGRTQDHRHVGHLLADDEREPEHAYAASTKDMNRWMNLAQAVRVSVNMLSGSHFRRHGASYALLDLPEDKGALEAVLRTTGRRAILRFLRDAGAAEVSVNFTRDGREQRLEVEGAPWAVEAALDQALGIADDEGSENRRGSRLRRVAPAPRKDPGVELRRAREALHALSSTDDFKRLKEALERRLRHLRKAVFDESMEIHEPPIGVQITIWLGDLKETVPGRSPGVAVRLRAKIRRLLHRTHDADLLTRLKSLHDEVAEVKGWFVHGERVLDEMEQAIRALGANDGSENRHPGSGPARGSRLVARGSSLRRVAPEPPDRREQELDEVLHLIKVYEERAGNEVKTDTYGRFSNIINILQQRAHELKRAIALALNTTPPAPIQVLLARLAWRVTSKASKSTLEYYAGYPLLLPKESYLRQVAANETDESTRDLALEAERRIRDEGKR